MSLLQKCLLQSASEVKKIDCCLFARLFPFLEYLITFLYYANEESDDATIVPPKQ